MLNNRVDKLGLRANCPLYTEFNDQKISAQVDTVIIMYVYAVYTISKFLRAALWCWTEQETIMTNYGVQVIFQSALH